MFHKAIYSFPKSGGFSLAGAVLNVSLALSQSVHDLAVRRGPPGRKRHFARCSGMNAKYLANHQMQHSVCQWVVRILRQRHLVRLSERGLHLSLYEWQIKREKGPGHGGNPVLPCHASTWKLRQRIPASLRPNEFKTGLNDQHSVLKSKKRWGGGRKE